MKQPKVYAHAPYIGTTGYNNHTREFLRHLSKHLDLKIRNYTVGKSWKELNNEPHNNEDYLIDLDKTLLHQQTLYVDKDKREDFEIYPNYPNNFEHNIDLVLQETNHYYFYEGYNGPKIGYNVWESTEQPKGFFNAWKEFDQMWVPSKWQAECTIKQGADPKIVKVVPEGVDTKTFYPEDPQTTLDYVDGRFKFIHFGRWDYRKSTKEIIETFLKEFNSNEPVDLILSIDNPWGEPLDGCKTTEERLNKFNISDPRLKVKHFPSREDYITYLKNGHVFLSCARSEGWNLPLIEAMACGTPSIYSACSGQMEFAEGKGLPVKVLGEKSTQGNNYSNFAVNLEDNHIPGNYYEPDYKDLARVMRDAYENYTDHKKRAIEEAKIIHRDFNWERVAEISRDTIQEFLDNYVPKPNKILVSYLDGPKVEIKGSTKQNYFIEFINSNTNEVIHSANITTNMWVTCNKKYYIPWIIKVNGKIVDKLDLTDKEILITLESKSIGDTLAWAPYAVEFAKKYNCKVSLSTFHNNWFKGLEAYKDINWLEPGSKTSCNVVYRIGWFRDNNGGWESFEHYPTQCNLIPLQQTATDILGLEFKELNYGVNFNINTNSHSKKYVAFGPQSTTGCKEWPYENWIILAKMFKDLGYDIIVLSSSPYTIPNTTNIQGKSWDVVCSYLNYADAFIGLGSGLSWMNWALGKHTYMINGFAKEGHEFTANLTKISNHICISCWNDPVHTFDAGDWDWCPVYKGTKLQHTCQKSITPLQVFNTVDI